jgi:fatty-acid desaturase
MVEINNNFGVKRIVATQLANPVQGNVKYSPIKGLWFLSMCTLTVLFGYQTLNLHTLILFIISTALVLCLGHSLGMHRLLIHRSYKATQWLDSFLIYCGALVGMSGPVSMIKTHDTRDWAQRHPICHNYFSHRESFWKDAWWQLCCEIELLHPPEYQYETLVDKSRWIQYLEKTWMVQQIFIAVVLYWIGDFSWVIWGVCARVAVVNIGHWLIGYFAHNQGGLDWYVGSAGVQGYNVPCVGLITMGESYHNNHHAFPGSAKLGLYKGQVDVGWYVLLLFKKLGWVWEVKLPRDLEPRPGLEYRGKEI